MSSFLACHVQTLTEDSEIKPRGTQIEYHPGFGQVESASYCRASGIVVKAWRPLGSGIGDSVRDIKRSRRGADVDCGVSFVGSLVSGSEAKIAEWAKINVTRSGV